MLGQSAAGEGVAARFEPALSSLKLVEPACSLCELVVSKPSCGCPGSWGRVLATGCQWWFRLSRSLALTCWLNQLQGGVFTCWLNQL